MALHQAPRHRKPKARASLTLGAGEGLEHAAAHLGRHAGAVVLHLHREDAVRGFERAAHAHAPGFCAGGASVLGAFFSPAVHDQGPLPTKLPGLVQPVSRWSIFPCLRMVALCTGKKQKWLCTERK